MNRAGRKRQLLVFSAETSAGVMRRWKKIVATARSADVGNFFETVW